MMASMLPSVIDESLFQCRLCCRSATDPRLLHCLHVFCRTCLLRHVAKLRAAAAQRHTQNLVDAGDQLGLEVDDRFASSSAVSQISGDVGAGDGGSAASCNGERAAATSSGSRPVNGPFIVGIDKDGYEIPRDDVAEDYEDVDADQTYANHVMVSGSHFVATSQGYAIMSSKPLTSTTAFSQVKGDNYVTGASASSPSTRGRESHGGEHGEHRLSSVSSTASTSTYVLPSQLLNNESIYENSDADDLDDVILRPDVASRRRGKKQQHGGKNVRRWKVTESPSTPPRLIRKTKSGSDNAVHGHQKLAASRSADELTTSRGSKSTVAGSQGRSQRSRFSYIYGSVGEDDADGGSDPSCRQETLDRLIPVYEEFKSATARSMRTSSQQRESHLYMTIDDLADTPETKIYEAERRTTTGLYAVAGPLPDDDEGSTDAASAQNLLDSELDVDLPLGDEMDSFPCPICEELSSVSLEDGDGGACAFVDAMQELIVSQAVKVRTCGNCVAAGEDGRRVAGSAAVASWRCLDCRHDLCAPCHDAHTSLQLTRDRHRVVSIADLQTGRHQDEISAALGTPCRQHSDHNAKSLCLDCDCVVCAKCRQDGGSHADHRVTDQLSDVAARQRDLISTLLDDTTRRLNELKNNGRDIADYRKQFEAERDDVIRAITEQRDRVVRLIDEFCSSLMERVRQEYGFETDNACDLADALERTCCRVDHAAKFARQLIEHGRPVDVVSLSPAVRSSLLVAARASPVPIDARLTVDFRPRATDVGDVEPIVGSVDIDRVPSSNLTAPDVAYSGQVEGQSQRRESSINENSGGSVRSNTGLPTATVVRNISDPCVTISEPILLHSFAALTTGDSKGCKPTAVTVAPDNEESDGTTLIVVVDDINKKVKVFDDKGKLHLEICPEGRRRLVDPWDVAILRQPRRFVPGKGAVIPTGAGRYVVTDRGAKDVKVFSASGEFVSSFGPHLSTPWGVCTNASKQVLVSDSGHRTVFVHDSTGILLFNVETCKHTVKGLRYHLQCPEYVAVSPANGDIVVTDFERHAVVIFDKFGRFLTRYIGADGASSTRSGVNDRTRLRYKRILEVPCGVAVTDQRDDGRIYVADYNNRRIVRLTRNGRYAGCFVAAGASSTNLVQPQALDFTADGRLVVVDRTHVKIFDIGVRLNAVDRIPAEGSSAAVTAPRVGFDHGPGPTSDAKSSTTKPKTPRTGPKPAVPPRPKFLKDLASVAINRPAHKDSAVNSTTTPTSSSQLTTTKTAGNRRTSTTSATSQTQQGERQRVTKSYLETEVW